MHKTRWMTWTAAFLLLASPTVASALPDQLMVRTVNGVEYVNPFDFTRSHAGSITGTSTGPTWVIRLRGQELKLTNGSAAAYLNGKRLMLSRPVGYARGVLLAPHTDLLRLFNLSAVKVSVPARPAATPMSAAQQPGRMPAGKAATGPATPQAATAQAPTPQAATPRSPAPSAPAPAVSAQVPADEPAPQAASRPKRAPLSLPRPGAAPPRPGDETYVIRSEQDAPANALAHPNHEQEAGDGSPGTVVRACLDGAAQQLALQSGVISAELQARHAARPSLFTYPGEVFNVRSSLEFRHGDGSQQRASFSCWLQRRGDRLVASVTVKAGAPDAERR